MTYAYPFMFIYYTIMCNNVIIILWLERETKDSNTNSNLSCLFVDSNRKANRAFKPKSGKLSKQGLGSANEHCRADVSEPLRRDRIGPLRWT